MNENIINKVENLSDEMITTVDTIVGDYCKSLDEYMEDIDKLLLNNKVVNDAQLENMIFNLSSILYFTSSYQESLGIKEDVCKAIRKEAYNRARDDKKGTVADKDAYATMMCQEEQLINDAYSRAYKKVKIKVDAGTEMLNSLKKIMTRRISEAELSKSKYTNTQV